MPLDLFADEQQPPTRDLFAVDPNTLDTPRKQALASELAKRGRIQLPDSTAPVQQAAPTQQAAPEPTGDYRKDIMQELASEIGPVQAFLIGAGEGMFNVGRGLGLVEPAEEAEKQAMAELSKQRPYTTGAGQIVGEAAPFVPLSLATGGAGSIAARMAASGGVGALEGGIVQAGRGEDVVGGTLLGGGIGAGAELVFPVIGKIGKRIYQKVFNKAPMGPMLDATGSPTPELQQALDKAGLTIDDLTDDAVKLLETQGGQLSPEQIARREFLTEEMGVEPTAAQVKRDATLFQQQQELAKTTGRVRTRLEAQEAGLTARFDTKIEETLGTASAPSVAVVDTILDKATVLDNEITSLYKEARELAVGEPVVDFSNFIETLKKLKPSNARSGGNIKAMIGEMQEKGVIDSKMNMKGNITVDMAEEARQLFSQLYDKQNGFGNIKIRQMKESFDDDVFRSTGKDLFSRARSAKAAYEKGLERAKVSKFDSRKQNLVRDLLENKIQADDLVKKVVYGKSWRAEDLYQLKNYTGGGDDWNHLRADVLDTIKNNSFIGPEDEAGFRSLSRHKIDNTLESIGWKKLNVIFNKDEIDFFKKMQKVAALREPVGKTFQGKGPSAQSVSQSVAWLERKMSQLPILTTLVQFVGLDAQGRLLIRAKPASTVRTPGFLAKQAEKAKSTMLPIGISAALKENE